MSQLIHSLYRQVQVFLLITTIAIIKLLIKRSSVFYLVLLVVSVLSTAFVCIHVVPDSLPVFRSSSLQEKGKVTFEEFSLDAERRAHGMRWFPATYKLHTQPVLFC